MPIAAAPLLLCTLLAPDLPDWLCAQEGYRYAPYRDSRGYWTVGYGHRSDGLMYFSRARALATLEADCETACQGALRVYPDLDDLPSAARFVLIAMAFQLGARGLAGFVDMRAHIGNGNYLLAAGALMRSRFAAQCPARARDLAARLAGVP